MDKEVYFSEEEKTKVLSLQLEIEAKKCELNNYIQYIQEKYGLDKTKLCLIKYQQAVVDKSEPRGFWNPVKYKLRDGIKLAFISWTDNHTDKFQVVFNEVSSNGLKGDSIYLSRFHNFSYEILEDVTVEEAKEILKERKKHLKTE